MIRGILNNYIGANMVSQILTELIRFGHSLVRLRLSIFAPIFVPEELQKYF